MDRHYLTLPDLGMGERPILASVWLVRSGASVIAGEHLLEVLCGEALVELPAPVSGVVRELLVSEDERLQVGQHLAVIEADQSAARAV